MIVLGGSHKDPSRTSTPPGGCVQLFAVIAVLCWQPLLVLSQSTVSVSFSRDQIVVQEDAGNFVTVSLPLIREGGTSGVLAVSIQLDGGASPDFFSNEAVALFTDGSSQTTVPISVLNDNIPEGNETFTWRIVNTGQAQLGTRATIQVIISASDQPHGELQFTAESLSSSVSEPVGTGSSVLLVSVARAFGTFGLVTVDYEVAATSASFGLDDISPLRGQLVFGEGVASASFNLSILADDIPELDETFTITLTTPTGGAALAASGTVAMVTILANDAPVRWAESLISVAEDAGTIQLQVTRGLTEDGRTLGNLGVETTVAVTTSSGSASATSDFVPVSTIITFAPMATVAMVPVSIVDDGNPEGDEMFTVTLSSVSADAVLAAPTVTMVIIQINDNAGGLVSFQSPGPVIVQEDTPPRRGSFTILRTIGSHGNLVVEWQILASDSSLATADFQTARGNVTMAAGVTSVLLEVDVVDDVEVEEAEVFSVELVRVVSDVGAISDTGHRLASVIIADSDNVYGLLDWGSDSQLQITGTAPRELMLAVVRSGGTVGIVAVDYTVWYTPTSSSTSSTSPAPSIVTTGLVQLQSGQSLLAFSVTLPNTLFLETGGSLQAVIDNTTLVAGATPLTQPTNSPRIGQRSTVSISIPLSATSGFISFDPASFLMRVNESADGLTFVTLTVLRSGSFGEATITWVVQPQTASLADVGQSAAMVTIQNGANSASFQVPVVADDVPEIDEIFTVRLLSVAQDNQMILQDQATAIVTILANDNPAGIFSIAAATQGPFFLNEDISDSAVISIVRTRGDLTRELVRYDLSGRAGQIAGGRGLADFPAGVREVNVTLLVINDIVPELNESFVFTISDLNSNLQLATPTSVDITILANDDFAGVFAFNTSTTAISIIEPPAGMGAGPASMATLEVLRSGGVFGSVSMEWVVSNPTSDLTPTRGVLVFSEGQTSNTFTLTATPDDISEGAESYSILLSVVAGEGRVDSSGAMATVTILQNDDLINFDGSFLLVAEGNVAQLNVARLGQAAGDNSRVM